MKILTNSLKDRHDETLAKMTISMNRVNPVIDRIMDDESVEIVIMTNKDGAPIITNIHTGSACNYGTFLQRLGVMANLLVKELDVFDEVLAIRLHTKKKEIMVAPHGEFNIIIVQQKRHKKPKEDKRKKRLS